MTKEVICPVCEGHGFSPIIGEYSITSHTCDHCNGSGLIKVPMTNADRIRAMSDEVLADVVVCPHTGNWDLCRDDCKKCRLEWLKQPVEDKNEN